MIRIKPELSNSIKCPNCNCQTRAKKIVLQTIFTMADSVCENCEFDFYQTLPIGHTIADTLTINKLDGKLYPRDIQKTWLTEALLTAYTSQKHEQVRIKKIVYQNCKQVVILNALDYLYGHVLLKLYNSIYHLDHHKELGLIIIIPGVFEWLIPKGCAEAWVVDLKLNDLVNSYSSVQNFISAELNRFDTIYLSRAYSHPDFGSIDISRFTGVKPFDLDEFRLVEPVFTFVLREDRWWLSGPMSYWFYRLCRKLKILKFGSRVLSMSQNRLIKKTIAVIRRKIPGAAFYVVGLGKTGDFANCAHDERKQVVSDSVEREWCKIYARSYVVIGVHGSNMLLPTAHAAGCVEILPTDRYGNIVQDISVRYTDRKQLYFYRYADEYSSPKSIASKAISIFEDFEIFERNMCQNIYHLEREAHGSFRQDDIYATY